MVFLEVAENFLCLVRWLEVTSNWVNPLIKELYFILHMLNYTLNKSQNRLKSLCKQHYSTVTVTPAEGGGFYIDFKGGFV